MPNLPAYLPIGRQVGRQAGRQAMSNNKGIDFRFKNRKIGAELRFFRLR